MDYEVTAKLRVSSIGLSLEVDGKQALELRGINALIVLTVAPGKLCAEIGRHLLGALNAKVPDSVLDRR